MAAPSALPLARDGTSRFLPWLIAMMVLLAALATGVAFAIGDGLQRWDAGLGDTMTVQLPVPSGDSLAPTKLDQVVAALHATRGIAAATPIDPSDTVRLIQPWLGNGIDPSILPLPVLIDVQTDGRLPPDIKALEARLGAIVPGATVARHAAWLDRLARVAELIELAASSVVALVLATAIVTVVFATRTGLALHAGVIDLLHLMGATDAYIARQFQWHAFRLGLQGGLIGLVMAFLGFGGIKLAAEQGVVPEGDELLPALHLSVAAWCLILALPLVMAATGSLTARVTVRRALARLP